MKCPACGIVQEANFETCPKCGVIVSKFIEKEKERLEKEKIRQNQLRQEQELKTRLSPGKPNNGAAPDIEVPIEDKYPALGMILLVVKVAAILPVIIAIASFFLPPVSVAASCGALGLSILWAVIIWASSESVEVFIDMERNQRKIIKLLIAK